VTGVCGARTYPSAPPINPKLTFPPSCAKLTLGLRFRRPKSCHPTATLDKVKGLAQRGILRFAQNDGILGLKEEVQCSIKP